MNARMNAEGDYSLRSDWLELPPSLGCPVADTSRQLRHAPLHCSSARRLVWQGTCSGNAVALLCRNPWPNVGQQQIEDEGRYEGRGTRDELVCSLLALYYNNRVIQVRAATNMRMTLPGTLGPPVNPRPRALDLCCLRFFSATAVASLLRGREGLAVRLAVRRSSAGFKLWTRPETRRGKVPEKGGCVGLPLSIVVFAFSPLVRAD